MQLTEMIYGGVIGQVFFSRYPHLMFRTESRKSKAVSFKQDANMPPSMGSHLPNYLRRTDSKDSSCSSLSSSQHRDLGASMSMPAHFHVSLLLPSPHYVTNGVRHPHFRSSLSGPTRVTATRPAWPRSASASCRGPAPRRPGPLLTPPPTITFT